jgi:beta-galactosidase beta subunit
MVIDLLDHLEWYVSLHPRMQALIELLDRGEVYEQAEGTYEHRGIDYQILYQQSSERGHDDRAKGTEVHVLLEGEEIFSIHDEWATRLVTTFTEGQFVLLSEGERYRSNQTVSTSRQNKRGIFTLA